MTGWHSFQIFAEEHTVSTWLLKNLADLHCRQVDQVTRLMIVDGKGVFLSKMTIGIKNEDDATLFAIMFPEAVRL